MWKKHLLASTACLVVVLSAVFFVGCGRLPTVSVSSKYLTPLEAPTSSIRKDIDEYATVATTSSPVTLLFFGDIMLDRKVKKQMDTDTNGFDYLLRDLAFATSSPWGNATAIIANLEGPVADMRRPTSKTISFRFEPSILPDLVRYGITTVSQANNHTHDMGSAGVTESLKNLKAAGIDAFGSEYAVNDDSLLVKDIEGQRVAFLGLNDTETPLQMKSIMPYIGKATTTADTLVVFMHWGTEYKLVSNNRQQKLAHDLIDAGADIVIGAHPHVVQEVEMYNGKPIFYSLGNFIFDQYFSKETQQGLGVELTFVEKKLTSFRLLPVQSEMSHVTWMEGDTRDVFLKELFERSRLSGVTTSTDLVILE